LFSKSKYSGSKAKEREVEATEKYSIVAPILLQFYSEGLSQEEIANKLNNTGHRTREGRLWTQPQVGRVLKKFTSN
jgi:hypothetical protein